MTAASSMLIHEARGYADTDARFADACWMSIPAMPPLIRSKLRNAVGTVRHAAAPRVYVFRSAARKANPPQFKASVQLGIGLSVSRSMSRFSLSADRRR